MDSINNRTWEYIRKMEAVFVKDKIIVQKEFIGETIYVFRREYYRKRNGKICSVDYPPTYFKTDWSKIKKYHYHNIFSSSDSDWDPLHISGTNYKFLNGYKEELIQMFLDKDIQ